MNRNGSGFLPLLLCTLVFLELAWAPHGLTQETQPFGGFTLMEIRNENIHQAVGINPGFPDGRATRLLTLVAGNRSYASLTKYSRSTTHFPACITWGKEGAEFLDEFVLGDGDSWQFDISNPRWNAGPLRGLAAVPHPGSPACAEFSLQWREPGSRQALFSHDDVRVVIPVIANYPIISMDWSDSSLSRFRINGYGLGTVTEDEALTLYARPERIDAIRPTAGQLKRLSFLSQSDSGQVNVGAFANLERLVSDGETEIAYLRYTHSRATDLGPRATFDQVMIERYGTPSAIVDAPIWGPDMIWAHDMHGRFLSQDDDSDDSCLKGLAEDDYAIRFSENGGIFTDIGPWSCGLVMILKDIQEGRLDPQDPSSRPVVQYTILLFHGHAIAHHWFSDRLDLVDALREDIPDRTGQTSGAVSIPYSSEDSPRRAGRSRRGR